MLSMNLLDVGELTMRIDDLTKDVRDMTDEELRESLKALRHRRSVIKPAAKKHKEKAVKKAVAKKVNKVEKLLDGMSEAEQLELLKALEADND